jgi:hypothetical protein
MRFEVFVAVKIWSVVFDCDTMFLIGGYHRVFLQCGTETSQDVVGYTEENSGKQGKQKWL